MATFYYIFPKEDDVIGVAKGPDGIDFTIISKTESIKDWKPIDFVLIGGAFPDYLGNDFAWPLVSSQLRKIIDEMHSGLDNYEWLLVNVESEKETRRYHALHFLNYPDVLDDSRSIFSGDFIVKPCISMSKVSGRSIFSVRPDGFSVVVSEGIAAEIITNGLVGIVLSEIAQR